MSATSRHSSKPSLRLAQPARPPPRCPTCSVPSRPTAVTSSPGWPRANGPRPAATSSPAASSPALLAIGRLHAAAGRCPPAAAAFRRAVTHEPLNETAHRELMDCWVRLGETARAVRHYRELAEVYNLVGVPPAAETTALYRRLAGRL